MIVIIMIFWGEFGGTVTRPDTSGSRRPRLSILGLLTFYALKNIKLEKRIKAPET
jgi:hypothetical protein